MSEEAARYNKGKLRWHNFPLFLIKPLIEVADYGADKYATYNFMKGANINQYLDCIKRHLEAFEDPDQDDNDSESKVNHLAHVAWNALVAVYMTKNRPDLDDRWKSPDKLASTKFIDGEIEKAANLLPGKLEAAIMAGNYDGTEVANEFLKQ